MNRDEKNWYITCALVYGIATVFLIGCFVGSGASSQSAGQGAIVTGSFLGAVTLIWLFRVTYFAGRHSR